MKDYRAIFDGVESTLIRVGSRNLPADEIRSNLAEFKGLESKTFSDAEYYWILVYVVFYSGFKAATVSAKIDAIRHHFSELFGLGTSSQCKGCPRDAFLGLCGEGLVGGVEETQRTDGCGCRPVG